MKSALIIVAALMLPLSANATCTKPVGVYVGSGAGSSVNTSTGQVSDLAAISLTVNIASNGTGTITERSKYYSNGGALSSLTYSATLTFTSSTSSCGGIVTLTSGPGAGAQYYFTSAGSGSVLTFIFYTTGTTVGVYNLRLEKV